MSWEWPSASVRSKRAAVGGRKCTGDGMPGRRMRRLLSQGPMLRKSRCRSGERISFSYLVSKKFTNDKVYPEKMYLLLRDLALSCQLPVFLSAGCRRDPAGRESLEVRAGPVSAQPPSAGASESAAALLHNHCRLCLHPGESLSLPERQDAYVTGSEALQKILRGEDLAIFWWRLYGARVSAHGLPCQVLYSIREFRSSLERAELMTTATKFMPTGHGTLPAL